MRLIAGTALAAAALGAAPAFAQTTAPPAQAARASLTSPRDVSAALRTCWRIPPALRRLERIDLTVRFSLRADGTLVGPQRVVFASLPADGAVRSLAIRSVADAVSACVPFNLDPGLAHGIAGRLFAIRLSYRGPRA